LEIIGVKVSKKAENFINAITPKLYKPVIYKSITELGLNNFGAMKEYPNHFIIYTSTKLTGEVFECNICHELLHAEQTVLQFPEVGNCQHNNLLIQITIAFTALILDLDVNQKLSANKFDSSYFFNYRYRVLKNLADRNFDMVTNNYYETLLILHLSLVLMTSPTNRSRYLLSLFKNQFNHIAEKSIKISEIINKIGYSTPEQCLICFGEIMTFLNLWDQCGIYYKNNNILSVAQYKSNFSILKNSLLQK